MNYNEFNGLGLLGQSIQYIKETNTVPTITKYEDFLENRSKMDKSFAELIDKKSQIPIPTISPIDTFLEYFLNNVSESNYTNIKSLEQRILTLDKAFNILKNEYNEHYSSFLENLENPDQYSKIMSDYLYIKCMNEFLERFTKLIEELPKIPKSIGDNKN
jgi:hypothetical protein